MPVLRSPLRSVLRSPLYSPLVGKWGGAFTLVLNGQPITLNAQFITLTPES